MFVEAYGAEAGNLALRTVATGGLFVGGGIAPKILPALTDGRFMRAFRAKPPFEAMLRGDAGEGDPERRGRAARRGGLRAGRADWHRAPPRSDRDAPRRRRPRSVSPSSNPPAIRSRLPGSRNKMRGPAG